MKIHSHIEINAPIEKVFDVFSDLNSLEDRVTGIQKVEILKGPTQMAVGTKWKETRVFMGKEATETMWVTELTRLGNYVVEAESHGTKYRSEYLFEQTANGTKVTVIFEATPMTFKAKLAYAISFLFAGKLKKLLYQDMVDLKKVCEG